MDAAAKKGEQSYKDRLFLYTVYRYVMKANERTWFSFIRPYTDALIWIFQLCFFCYSRCTSEVRTLRTPYCRTSTTLQSSVRQASELGGGAFEGQTHILGGKIEFLKRYCYLPMPLSQDFCPPPRRFAPLKRGRYS